MINCTILDGSQEPAETFIEATTRFVRVPSITEAKLACAPEEDCFMSVKVEEEEVFGVAIDASRHVFSLPAILSKAETGSGIRFRTRPTLKSEDELPRQFSVVFRLANQAGPILGTFEFELLNAKGYDSKYHSHCELHETRCQPAVFTRDARSVETAVNCWNCETPMRAGDACCRNCHSCQDDPR